MMQCDYNYRTVAVIGCQSSGKSTLMNLLFGTSFEVMNETLGQQQTTKGIWLNRNSDCNILVMDIEGTDSKERGDDRVVSNRYETDILDVDFNQYFVFSRQTFEQ